MIREVKPREVDESLSCSLWDNSACGWSYSPTEGASGGNKR